MYVHRLLLYDRMQELHRTPLKGQPAVANKERPKQHAKGIQIRPVVLRNRLRRAGLLRGQVAHRLLDLPLLPLGQLARLDDEAARAAEALERDGAVPKVREAHDARVRVDVERVGADLAVDDARLVERLEAVRRADGELEEGGEVHDVPGLGVARALVLCVPVHGEARAVYVLDLHSAAPDLTAGKEQIAWGRDALKETVGGGVWHIYVFARGGGTGSSTVGGGP